MFTNEHRRAMEALVASCGLMPSSITSSDQEHLILVQMSHGYITLMAREILGEVKYCASYRAQNGSFLSYGLDPYLLTLKQQIYGCIDFANQTPIYTEAA